MCKYDIDNSFVKKFVLTFLLKPYKKLFFRSFSNDKIIFTEEFLCSRFYLSVDDARYFAEIIKLVYDLDVNIERIDDYDCTRI